MFNKLLNKTIDDGKNNNTTVGNVLKYQLKDLWKNG